MASYTIDASVFLNAFNPREPDNAESQALLARLQKQALPLIAPTLLLPELAATVSRGRQDAGLARRFAEAVSRMPNLILVPLDLALSRQAAEVAADHRLRGSDAVYAAVALRFGATLVSLDREQLRRVRGILRACSPLEALREIR